MSIAFSNLRGITYNSQTYVTTISRSLTVVDTINISNTNTSQQFTALNLLSNLNVSGVTTLFDRLSIAGNVNIAGTNFTVLSTTGNTTIAGTLSVGGATTLSNLTVNNLSVVGSFILSKIDIAGTLSVGGNVNIAGTNFTVLSATGNTTIAGTLSVGGATTFASTLAANGGFTCDSTAFSIADVTGNTTIAGTLSVGSNIRTAGTIQFISSDGNGYRAFRMDSGQIQTSGSGGIYTGTFTKAFPTPPYVIATALSDTTNARITWIRTVSAGGFSVNIQNDAGTNVNDAYINWIAMG